MAKQFITSEAMIRSLHCSLESVNDPAQAASSIRRRISKLPDGTVFILHDRGYIKYYERANRKKIYLKRESDRLCLLARKRYLTELIETLMVLSTSTIDSAKFKMQFEKLTKLVQDFAEGNLDLARIAFAPRQYKWFVESYRRKRINVEPGAPVLKIPYGNIVRSKSEQSIGNALWDYAIPCHYEEQLQIDVRQIVERMIRELKTDGWNENNIFYYRGGVCYWNVPKEMQFMNAPSSLWHTYDYRNGYVTIYPDYTMMLTDGTMLYWEHEGLLDNIVYRINAIDRVFVMRSAGNISPLTMIETEEKDSIDRDALEDIIRTRVLQGIWF